MENGLGLKLLGAAVPTARIVVSAMIFQRMKLARAPNSHTGLETTCTTYNALLLGPTGALGDGHFLCSLGSEATAVRYVAGSWVRFVSFMPN